jgi:alpha-beta hydrolase superfamily lysophospholipase
VTSARDRLVAFRRTQGRIPRLARQDVTARGLRFAAYDQRGRGESEAPADPARAVIEDFSRVVRGPGADVIRSASALHAGDRIRDRGTFEDFGV